MIGVVERCDTIGWEVAHVVERVARLLYGRMLVAILGERFQPSAKARRPQRTYVALELRGRRGAAVPLGAFGTDLHPQRRQRIERGTRVAGGAPTPLLLVAQRPQRCVLVRSFGADVLADRIVETRERTQRGVLLGAAVQCLRQGGGNLVRRTAVQPDRSLPRAGRLKKYLERDAELRVAGVERLAAADARRGVGAAGVVNAHALRVALERAMHFPARAVGRLIRQRRRERVPGPRPPTILLAALQTVQRSRQRGGQGRLSGLVRSDDDVEPGPERERPAGEPPETVDAQRAKLHRTAPSAFFTV